MGDSVLIKVMVGGQWSYWSECWGIDTVLAQVESACRMGYQVMVVWPADCSYLVAFE